MIGGRSSKKGETMATLEQLEQQLEELRKENEELTQTFNLMWEADTRGIKMWQAEKPGRELIHPDRGDLVRWLLNKLDEKEKEK